MMQALSIWQLALPLPAVLMIAVSVYMVLVGAAIWVRYCLKDRCSVSCADCCPGVSVCDQCFRMAEVCDCRPPSVRSCLSSTCPSCSCPSPSDVLSRQESRCCPLSEGGRFEAGSVAGLCTQTLPCECPALCCAKLDCACTCQPPECDTCNCLCFEIRIK